jgi:hypothetical protein
VALFREREEELHTAFDRLQWRRERFRGAEGIADGVVPSATEQAGGRLSLAGRLRRCETWGHLSDEQVFALSSMVPRRFCPELKVFEHGRRHRLLPARGRDLDQRHQPGTFPSRC